MLVDTNVLLYATDRTSTFHANARAWLEEALNGERRVGIPWVSYWAFVRIATNPRALENPLPSATAWQMVTDWIAAPASWIPEPGEGHATILGGLIERHDVRGPLLTDAVLAALCIEHGLSIVSNDSVFGNFPEVRRVNPFQ